MLPTVAFLSAILIPEIELSTSRCFISMKLHSSFHSSFKKKPPAIGGLFYGVSSGSGLGRASNTRSENKNLYLETDEFASTPPFSKKPLAGAFRSTVWRELFKNYLAGTFSKKHLAGIFQKIFSGNF
jgi:hypothetical protein